MDFSLKLYKILHRIALGLIFSIANININSFFDFINSNIDNDILSISFIITIIIGISSLGTLNWWL